MKISFAPLLFCFLLPSAFADDNGGLKKDTAPPPAHALDEGYRGTENARIMTVEQAKTMHDGATISLRGNLIEDQGGDKFIFRDKTGSINTLGNDSNLLIVFYVQIMPDDFVMQLHRF
ncbi:NirD/YgiW/YdeI family stress tolerance protein [Klebsiella pneumoniae]|uniref:NirD/YgiW/YdeI family stress tolerance protein n=1 Tax=Klebsiella pneumoniae TaxID=573 RepID=UPI00096A6470|nr:NirD/YgiW/YdeI family stress tolerance protein [Klebsiella pneumoniae]